MRKSALPRKRAKPRRVRVKCPIQRCGKAPYRETQCANLCRKHIIERLDHLARARVMERDGTKCVRCGSEKVIQWSHWPSRSYHATRWLQEGAVAHCSQCHLDLTYRPLEHEQHMIEFWGEETLSAIKRRALDGASGSFVVDFQDVLNYLDGQTETKYGSPLLPSADLPPQEGSGDSSPPTT